jgi:hypothetical protein
VRKRTSCAGPANGGEPGREALPRPDHDFVLSTQVLVALYAVITRTLRPALPAQAAAEVITSLCKLPVVGTDAELV